VSQESIFAQYSEEELDREQQAEIEAENAWLRAAENAIPQADLDYEAECEAQDSFLLFLDERGEGDL